MLAARGFGIITMQNQYGKETARNKIRGYYNNCCSSLYYSGIVRRFPLVNNSSGNSMEFVRIRIFPTAVTRQFHACDPENIAPLTIITTVSDWYFRWKTIHTQGINTWNSLKTLVQHNAHNRNLYCCLSKIIFRKRLGLSECGFD